MRKRNTIIGLLILLIIGFSIIPGNNVFAEENENAVIHSTNISLFDMGNEIRIYRRAEAILNQMTYEEKVCQMLLVCCSSESSAINASEKGAGGVVLFAGPFQNKSKSQVIAFTSELQEKAKYGFLISVDEEGGTVVRISSNPNLRSEKFKSPRYMYDNGDLSMIVSDTEEKCDLLKELGVNVNLAPVCDVCTDSSGFMYKRAYGKSAEEAAFYVENVVSIMDEEKMGIVLKHFPGYGNNGDTHTNVIRDSRDKEEYYENDFKPFMVAIENMDTGGILVSHTIVESFDAEYPASLSVEMHRVLREDLGFEGVILTDDLSMDGITEYTSANNAIVQAVIAGNDLLLCSNFSSAKEAILDSDIDEERINESVMRILIWKIKLGLV